MQLNKYINELKQVQLLKPEEEKLLWQAYKKKGDDNARMRLIESYQPLVFKLAMPFQDMECIMDIIQEGTVGLIEAAESYDISNGAAFSLFATYRVRGRIYNFLKKEGRADIACLEGVGPDGHSKLAQVADAGIPVPEIAELHEMALCVRQAMDRLPFKEKLVLNQVYLESQPVSRVADELNVSESHVYRLQQKGIRRVRGMLSRFIHGWR